MSDAREPTKRTQHTTTRRAGGEASHTDTVSDPGVATPGTSPLPLLLVSVGTDCHPFDRLIEWVDRWLAEGADERVRCLVQHGASRTPKAGDAREYLDHAELQRAMGEASIVVCHGGPATITEAHRTGHVPVVVPRDPSHGEHVDDHQLRFTRHLADAGMVACCTREYDFRDELDAALAEPERFRRACPGEGRRGEHGAGDSVRRAGTLIDELLGGTRGASAVTGPATTETSPVPGPVTTGAVERTQWPAVSVVIPTKHRPELLPETITGILGQHYPGQLRCLVVFDGADPDRALARDGEHRSVAVIANTRTPGLAGGRNSGILAADGELVAFCDDDDVWLPHKLRTQVEALRSAPEASMVCCGVRVDYDGATVDRALPQRRVARADLLRSRLTELHPSTFLMRRTAVLDGFGLVDEELPGSYAEDYELLLRAAAYGPVVNLPEVGVRIRWHARSHFASRWETIARALAALLERHPFRDVPEGYARVAGQIAFARAALGERREALRWARRTLRANPAEARAYLALAVASRAITPERVLRTLHRNGRGL